MAIVGDSDDISSNLQETSTKIDQDDLPWPMVNKDQKQTRRSPYDTTYIEGDIKWTHSLPSKYSSDILIGDEGPVYIDPEYGSRRSRACFVNRSDGKLDKSYTLDYDDMDLLALGNDTIYTGSGNDIHVFKEDGNHLWSKSLFGNVTSAVMDDDLLYVGAINKSKMEDKLYCISKEGEIEWTFEHYLMPAVGDKNLFVANRNTIYTLNTEGQKKWDVTLDEDIERITSISIGPDERIYAIGTYTDHSALFALNKKGDILWSKSFESVYLNDPAISKDGTVYITPTDSDPARLYSISKDGETNWKFNADKTGMPPSLQRRAASDPVVGGKGTVYFTACTPNSVKPGNYSDGILFSINKNGQERWNHTFEEKGFPRALRIGECGTIYARLDRTLYAFGEEGPPSQVIDLKAVGSDNQVDISWDIPKEEGFGGIQKYKIYRGTSEDDLSLLATSSSDGYIDLDVENGVKYYYRVSAVNEAGEGPMSDNVEVTPLDDPSKPADLEVISVDGGSVDLDWDEPDDDGGADSIEYKVYRGKSEDDLTIIDTVSYTGYNDTDVNKGETYYYSISTVNKAGESDQTSIAEVSISEDNTNDDTPGYTLLTLIISISIVSYYRIKKDDR